MPVEDAFDAEFAGRLSLREKQIQQVYRPVVGIHKWFARRPGSLFRCLLLAEYGGARPLRECYWEGHRLSGVVADPFMGGGTPVYEANRLGLAVIGADINPMSFWLVRQALSPLDLSAFSDAARGIRDELDRRHGRCQRTICTRCGAEAPVKYYLWVKQLACPACGVVNDLFPGYRLAEAVRHPAHVLVCAACGALNELAEVPRRRAPVPCAACGEPVHLEGPARRNRVDCRACGHGFRYPAQPQTGPPRHRLWALEYHCALCTAGHKGRFFKAPDADDLGRLAEAEAAWEASDLTVPGESIPAGDETRRLHRWGYGRYRELFSSRQLLLLGSLFEAVRSVETGPIRDALLTVFSDSLRYQNLLCRYDTYALKCQDVFSVHGFPVGLVQCENNVLGIPRVGSGGFGHFVEKYARAKAYCAAPFERARRGARAVNLPTAGERIEAELVQKLPPADGRMAALHAAPAETVPLDAASLDGVFTDPPYYDNVQYAELMDFCFVWLRQALAGEHTEFRAPTTRHADELTGNATLGRGLLHFTDGLSRVFRHYAAALKPGAPFVFTYHHNDPVAYAPLVVAVLDAGLACTATLPAAAEMSASLHIARTGSSVLDTVFVCRPAADVPPPGRDPGLAVLLESDLRQMQAAGLRVREGDARCLSSGHLARVAMGCLGVVWDPGADLPARLASAQGELARQSEEAGVDALVAAVLGAVTGGGPARRSATDCRTGRGRAG